MAKIERLDNPETSAPGYSRVLVTLAEGEHCATAGSTKKAWHGPGSFVRTTWPDGGREVST